MKKKKKFLLSVGILLILTGCGAEQTPEAVSTITAVQEEMLTNTPVPTATKAPTPTPTNTPTPSPTFTPTPTNTPTPTPIPEVKVSMVGDILLHDRIEKYSVQEDGSYNFSAVFRNTWDEIRSADIALVNQEVILGGAELGISGYPAFNGPHEVGDALVEAGFDVVLHATNHALDKRGKEGLLRCIEFWEETYPEIGVLGIHDSKEDQEELYIIEENGIRIAILNYTYGTNGIPLPSDMPYAVDLLDEERVISDLQKAEELADFVIVCPHWGTEYRLTPDKSQKKWAKLFLEYGVDLVLGTHPHVIEPIEWLTQEETGEKMLVYYSIGNFVNWTSGSGKGVANRMVGGIANVTIRMDENGKAYIAEYGVDAIVCHTQAKTNGITVYTLSEYSEELADKNAIRKQDGNFSYSYCIDLCNQVWGDLWK